MGVVDVRELERFDHAHLFCGNGIHVGAAESVAFGRSDEARAARPDDAFAGALDHEDVAADPNTHHSLAACSEANCATANPWRDGGVVEVEHREHSVRIVPGLVHEQVLGEGPYVDVAAGFGDGDAELLLRGAATEGGIAPRNACKGRSGGGDRAAAYFVTKREVRTERGQEEGFGREDVGPVLGWGVVSYGGSEGCGGCAYPADKLGARDVCRRQVRDKEKRQVEGKSLGHCARRRVGELTSYSAVELDLNTDNYVFSGAVFTGRTSR